MGSKQDLDPALLGEDTRVQADGRTAWEKRNVTPEPEMPKVKPAASGEGITFLSPRWPNLVVFVGATEMVRFQEGRLTVNDPAAIRALDATENVYREGAD